MMYVWMCGEKVFQNSVVYVFVFFQWQVEFQYLDLWKMVLHVVAETYFAVVLLLACHLAVFHLLHQHDFLFAGCYQHEHFRREISAAERVLTIERQRFKVWHVRVEQYERNVAFVQLVGEFLCYFKFARHNDYAVRVVIKAFVAFFFECVSIETLVIHHLYMDVEVTSCFTRLVRSLLNLVPISFRPMPRNYAIECVRLVVCKCACIHVGLIVDVFQYGFHLLSCRL